MDEIEPPKLSRFERLFGRNAPVNIGLEFWVMVIAMGLIAYFAKYHH